MILASAQTKPKRGDVEWNLLDHYRLVEMASDNGAELVVFPEMSITGYERQNAASLAFSPDDSRLDKLRQLAVEKQITIIAGAPVVMNSDMFIGGFALQTNGSVGIYTKQFLYPGEDDYFKPSCSNNPLMAVGSELVSLAICFDLENPSHPENASKEGCSLYVPSIFYSPNGISGAHRLLGSYAEKYSMNVLLSNYGGESWGQPSGGRSAFWNNRGELVAEMGDSDSGLLVVENNNDGWKGKVIKD